MTSQEAIELAIISAENAKEICNTSEPGKLNQADATYLNFMANLSLAYTSIATYLKEDGK